MHYAVLTNTDGVITYDAPVSIPGAVSMSLAPATSSLPLTTPDYFATTTGIKALLKWLLSQTVFLTDVMGYIEDANGVVGELSTAQPSAFALMFEFNGDSNRVGMYYTTAARLEC